MVKGKSKSAAQTKARYNLKQVGTALSDYAQQSAQVDTSNAVDVQEQAQQIESEIKRLEELKTGTKRADGETDFYFRQPRREPKGVAAVAARKAADGVSRHAVPLS